MADITSIQLPTSLSTANVSTSDSKKMQSYLYQLTEQLRYVLSNLDSENMSSSYNSGVSSTVAQISDLSESESAHFEELKAEIVSTATRIVHDTESSITLANDALKTEIEESYTAENESLQATLEQLIASEISQTSRSLEVSLTQISNIAEQTAEALATYSTETETWFRFTEDGLELGKCENGETVPYTLRIDNECLSFLHYGQQVAYLQYNRLYISAAEVSDRLSIGGSAGEGYYDFITTATGLGIKWRAN